MGRKGPSDLLLMDEMWKRWNVLSRIQLQKISTSVLPAWYVCVCVSLFQSLARSLCLSLCHGMRCSTKRSPWPGPKGRLQPAASEELGPRKDLSPNSNRTGEVGARPFPADLEPNNHSLERARAPSEATPSCQATESVS